MKVKILGLALHVAFFRTTWYCLTIDNSWVAWTNWKIKFWTLLKSLRRKSFSSNDSSVISQYSLYCVMPTIKLQGYQNGVKSMDLSLYIGKAEDCQIKLKEVLISSKASWHIQWTYYLMNSQGYQNSTCCTES